ncbi:glutaredoxin family protein [Aestuariimicrobium sp. T2.26MG-19.2B]|uniref:glutaredoxin family protein n=1 Tax=Aestuariimicrobium sp. T2.26MG-19.2B TaxID=3040679 RepID=UPI00254127E6|nr:glutaredoxin family protein [Aestuariimicrobium sp. T2.26MG-19.2B]
MKPSQPTLTPGGQATGSPPQVTLLVTTGCHYCEDASEELATRVALGELQLEVVPLASKEGEALQATHRPAMFPLVLIEGKQFSVGRLPRRKLDRMLARGTTN